LCNGQEEARYYMITQLLLAGCEGGRTMDGRGGQVGGDMNETVVEMFGALLLRVGRENIYQPPTAA
jgi:hypothetical protein